MHFIIYDSPPPTLGQNVPYLPLSSWKKTWFIWRYDVKPESELTSCAPSAIFVCGSLARQCSWQLDLYPVFSDTVELYCACWFVVVDKTHRVNKALFKTNVFCCQWVRGGACELLCATYQWPVVAPTTAVKSISNPTHSHIYQPLPSPRSSLSVSETTIRTANSWWNQILTIRRSSFLISSVLIRNYILDRFVKNLRIYRFITSVSDIIMLLNLC